MPIFLQHLKQSDRLADIHMTVCNVGSRKIGNRDDYATLGWQIFAPNLNIYGFDADADACEAANADLEQRKIDWKEKHIPLALGNREGEATLYVTKHPMCSSLYPPNEGYLARFALGPEFINLKHIVNLDYTIEIETTTLDAVCEAENINSVDFLQIDVQGADLQVLEGANRLLEHNVLAIQIEVEFSHLYANQPLFSDVDSFLRKQGFSLFDLACTRCIRSRSPIHTRRHPGQLLWADAFYFRDLLQEGVESVWKNPQTIFKLACVTDVMDFSDYSLELLEYLTLNYGADDERYDFSSIILTALAQFPQLVQQGLEKLEIVANLRSFRTQTGRDTESMV